jgi:membrane-anchored protein YejM (alkaline phosphatase superfamily)
MFFAEGIHLTDVFLVKPALLFTVDKLKITQVLDIYKITVLICCGVIEFLLLNWLDKNLWIERYHINKKLSILTIACFIISQAIYHTGSCMRKNYISSAVAYLPWYKPANSIKTTNTWQQLTKYNDNKINNLNYPLKPLETTTVKKPMNILMIGIDAWRADYFNEIACPNLWQLAQTGVIFNKHMSGANFTRQGIFSLFYGIPATYWYSFIKQQKSPVFIDRLQQLNYQIGVFLSMMLPMDRLDKTTFSKIDNLCLEAEGNTSAEKDNSITNNWLNWFNNIDKNKPFFSFVFYFSSHEHDFPTAFNLKSIPTGGKLLYKNIIAQQGMQGFKQGYQTSIQYIDNLASKIITALKQTDTLKNTLIIITSDHGHELNDHLQHHYGHASNLTDCQLHVPFAIIGGDFNNKHINTNELTTHYDFVPTIMKNFLGVNNNITDYSVGNDLLNTEIKQKWHIATNSRLESAIHAVGIITKDYIQQYLPSGKFTLLNKNNRPIQMKSLDYINYFPEAFEMMTRFIKK